MQNLLLLPLAALMLSTTSALDLSSEATLDLGAEIKSNSEVLSDIMTNTGLTLSQIEAVVELEGDFDSAVYKNGIQRLFRCLKRGKTQEECCEKFPRICEAAA